MIKKSLNSFNTKDQFEIGGKSFSFYNLNKLRDSGIDVARLPFSLKVLLENMLRFEDNSTVTKDDVLSFETWIKNKQNKKEISYRPARVLMQDFTGVPAVVDLAAMRDAVAKLGSDPKKINPLNNVDLVIDHSVMVDKYGTANSFLDNVKIEFERNKERYEFLKWGQQAFDNFKVVPPGTGICHQVNLENLAQVVNQKDVDGETFCFPDTCVGTDSHTTMINGLAVLGWGVGGIEAESSMLGQPISMLIPDVIGFKLKGKLKEGTTATDVVLTATKMLREKGVVGKFVEYYGDGLNYMSLADRATLANMAPEYGATCGFFPIDQETINYLELTARSKETIELVEKYAKLQGMWRDSDSEDPIFTDTLELDLADVEPCISGPKRPQDKILLKDAASQFVTDMADLKGKDIGDEVAIENHDFNLDSGKIVIAAITSCTNTSNPSVMIAAGLVAQKASELGINVKPWVKTSLAPGSQVVTEYLAKSGLNVYLDELGFNLVGYGCTTCIGNSGPLITEIEDSIKQNDLTVCSVLSGNRNFEGRVHPLVKANYLTSPPLVVAYAIAGSMNIDISKDPVGVSKEGKEIYLKDIWPSNKEIQEKVSQCITSQMFAEKYADVFKGDENWQNIELEASQTYNWNDSTYINNPPYFEGMKREKDDNVSNIENANIMALFGDSITTDHISPAGSIAKDSPAATYLTEKGVPQNQFNSYGSRRGNHEVMMRGTFANIRIKNELAQGKTGGYTKCQESGEIVPIYDFCMKKKAENTPLVVFAGKDYGMGSSRDWAAKGTILLGVKAVISESFERIHRSNLIGMGVLPLNFKDGVTWQSLNLKGDENISIIGVDNLSPRMDLTCKIERSNGEVEEIRLLCRIDTSDEVAYYKNGGILQYVIRELI